MPRFILLLILSVFFTKSLSSHPFYVSIFTLEQPAGANNVEITARIFFDDLEDALEKEFGTKTDLLNPVKQEENDRLIDLYFQRYFRVKVNGTLKHCTYIGYNIEEDAAWCYLEIEESGIVNGLSVQNQVLYRSHEKQSNILHVTVGGERQSLKLDNPRRLANFSF